MGLLVFVHRPAGFPDGTNDGISGRHTKLCVVNVEGPFEPSDDIPAAIVKPSPTGRTWVIEPVEKPEGMVGPMHGGNLADATDSRWTYGAVRIHDRFETEETYRALSTG